MHAQLRRMTPYPVKLQADTRRYGKSLNIFRFFSKLRSCEAEAAIAARDWWDKYLPTNGPSQMVAWLAHDECGISGEIVDATGSYAAHQYLAITEGYAKVGVTRRISGIISTRSSIGRGR